MANSVVFNIKQPQKMQYSITEFETLYTRCFPPSMRLALSMLHDEDEARDVVHEVFLKLWQEDMKIATPEAFIMRAVRNTCINRINSLDIHAKIQQRIMLEAPPDDYEADDINADIQRVIPKLLTQREQDVVERVYSEGLSYKETADNLGISTSAVNKHIVAALRKLRNHFKTGKS